VVLAIQHVELVGHESWLHKNSGSIVLAIAAMSAAALAAYVAVHNQRRQIEHDRFLRNQDHIRDTIDQALFSANETRNGLDQFMATIETAEEARSEKKEVPSTLQQQAHEERTLILAKLQAMLAAQARLEARLGDSHQVSKTHKKTALGFSRVVSAALDGVDSIRAESVRKEDPEREAEGEKAFREFQIASYTWFNS
jgi:hypothetical protein